MKSARSTIELTEDQLTDYCTDGLQAHSWSTAKHRLYGQRFYYTPVLHKAPELIKSPKVRRFWQVHRNPVLLFPMPSVRALIDHLAAKFGALDKE